MNARVNYPVKKILNALVNEENIDMDDEATKFCVSWVTSRVCHVGSLQVIDAWNSHSIPGKGIDCSGSPPPLYCIVDITLDIHQQEQTLSLSHLQSAKTCGPSVRYRTTCC